MNYDYRNTKKLLDDISEMNLTPVAFLIDDLNEKCGEEFKYNDYLRNKELPLAIRQEASAIHRQLVKEQNVIMENVTKKTKKLGNIIFKVGLVVIILIVLLT